MTKPPFEGAVWQKEKKTGGYWRRLILVKWSHTDFTLFIALSLRECFRRHHAQNG